MTAAEQLDDPMIGVMVADRYRIECKVGTGGMGSVYRAHQSGLGRDVALKILKPELNWDAETVARFNREAKAMSMLVHPNTTRVYDFGETELGLPFLAIEYLEGALLSTHISDNTTLRFAESISIARQILSSLQEAHMKGLVHRDLKPDNIMLTHLEGEANLLVKVLDFGIAKIVQGEGKEIDQLETQAGTVFGTPRYMSPEQAQGKPLDARSDLYAVGILLYQMVTGEPPFMDDDAVVVMAKHIREHAEPPSSIVPERHVPQDIDRVIMKAIEKRRERRFQSASEFIAALDACLANLNPDETGARRIARSKGKGNTVWLLAAAAVLLGAIAATGALMLFTRNGDPAPTTRVTDPSAAEGSTEGEPSSEQAAVPVGSRARVAHVRSTPSGARIIWQGQERGLTPMLMGIEPGESPLVRLEKEGFEPAEVILTQDDHLVELTPFEDEDSPTRRAGSRAGGSASNAESGAAPAMRRRPRMRRPRDEGQTTSMGAMTVANDGYEAFD